MAEYESPLYEVRGTPNSVTPLSGVRGTVVIATRDILRTRALLDAHEAFLSIEARMALGAVAANDIVPMHLVHAHEEAFDRLALRRDEVRSIGAEVSRSVDGVHATFARLVGKLGTSPWRAFRHAAKAWNRAYVGGTVVAFRCGERRARVEVWGDSLARYAQHREAFGGGLIHVLSSYGKRPSVQELPERRTATTFAVAVGW